MGENARRISLKNKSYVLDSIVISGRLHSYLVEIDEQSREMFDNLVEQMKVNEGVTEEHKERN